MKCRGTVRKFVYKSHSDFSTFAVVFILTTYIPFIAPQECIIVCVVSLEEVDITPSSVPFVQCREIRTDNGRGASSDLNYMIIPASAAIVATVIIAVIIFIACMKTSQKRRNTTVMIFQEYSSKKHIAFLKKKIRRCVEIGEDYNWLHFVREDRKTNLSVQY